MKCYHFPEILLFYNFLAVAVFIIEDTKGMSPDYLLISCDFLLPGDLLTLDYLLPPDDLILPSDLLLFLEYLGYLVVEARDPYNLNWSWEVTVFLSKALVGDVVTRDSEDFGIVSMKTLTGFFELVNNFD